MGPATGPARARRAAEATPIAKRHGRAGHVRLAVDVPPDVKDALIELAWRKRTPLREQAEAALIRYLVAEGAL